MAGIVGNAANNSRIRGSNGSTIDPVDRRAYRGGLSDATAARTVFRDTFSTLAIILIGNPSARRARLATRPSCATAIPATY